MTMTRRLLMALLVLLLAAGAQAQMVGGGPYLWSSSTQRGLEAADVATSLTDTTTGLVAQTLRTWNIEAGALLSKPGFTITAWAATAANGNSKTLVIKVGGTGVCVRSTTTASDAVFCSAECTVESSTSLTCRATAGMTSSVTTYQTVTTIAALNFAAAIPVLVQGTTATAAGDLTLTSSKAYFFRY
jgi:hypothetical protein